jgi:hypothetical protein
VNKDEKILNHNLSSIAHGPRLDSGSGETRNP